MQSLLCIAESTATSALDQLRKPPVYISAPGMVDALLRLKQFRNLALEDLNLQRVLPKINSSSGCEYSEFFTRALELILRSGADGAGPVAAHKRSLPTSPDDGRDAG